MPLRGRAIWQGVSVAATGLLLWLLYVVQPEIWLIKDKFNQYLPVYRDIGWRLQAGEFPLIDPDLGSSGNFALDLQYGLYEPSHWLTAVALSHVDDLQLAGFLWALGYLLIFAWGACALALRLDVPATWAATCGLAVATSGYVLYWLALSWMPGLVSIAWLPWLWWAWVGPAGRLSARGCVSIAAFTYLAVAGGWPATWVMYAGLIVGLAVEEWRSGNRATGVRTRLRPLATRGLSSLAGLAPAALTVLPLAAAREFTTRSGDIFNDNFQVSNLFDVAGFSSPELHGEMFTFTGPTVTLPIYFAGWFAIAVFWLVRWNRAVLRRRGVVTAAVGFVLMLLLTQSPSYFGPLTNPVRYLAGVQFFFAVGGCLLVTAAPLVVTRRRIAGVVVSLFATGWLTWARAPGDQSAVLAVLLVGLAVAVLVVVLERQGLVAAGAAALGGTLLLSTLAFWLNAADDPHPRELAAAIGTPGRLTFSGEDQPALAIAPVGGPVRWSSWYADGVGRSFQRLSRDTRLAPGYSSIQQLDYKERFCLETVHGAFCPDVFSALFSREASTGRTWLSLLGYRTVLITGPAEIRHWRRLAGNDWRVVARGQSFTELRRRSPKRFPGRVTAVLGDADIRVRSLASASQSYRVDTADGATVVFRDLYWPGYQATIDGRPLRVRPLDGTLTAVELPADTHGELSLTYAPLSRLEVVAAVVACLALLSASAMLAERPRWPRWLRRRQRVQP